MYTAASRHHIVHTRPVRFQAFHRQLKYVHISSLSRCQEGIVPHSSPSYGLLPYCRFRLPPQSNNTTPLFQTSSTFVQLPRKTGRTISSHPQAFPLALSVHIQNCHKYFRENLSKVFTRTAVTIPGTFSPFGDRQGIACLPLLQQLAHACQGRFIWLIRLPPILCLQGHAGFEQFTLRAKVHSWNSHTGDTSANYYPTASNRKQPDHILHGKNVPSYQPDSNRQPIAYRAIALPFEL